MEHSSSLCLQEIIYSWSTLTLLMQFPNMKNYLEIEPITSSKFEVGIIYVKWGFISTTPSLPYIS